MEPMVVVTRHVTDTTRNRRRCNSVEVPNIDNLVLSVDTCQNHALDSNCQILVAFLGSLLFVLQNDRGARFHRSHQGRQLSLA